MRMILSDGNHLTWKQIFDNKSSNFWLHDYHEDEIVNVKLNEQNYVIYSNKKYKIIKDFEDKNNVIESQILEINCIYYILNIETNQVYTLYYLNDFDDDYKKFKINSSNAKIVLAGKYFVDADIIIESEKFEYSKIEFILEDNFFKINLKDVKEAIYVCESKYNNEKVKYGSNIFFDGVFINILKNIIVITHDNNKFIYKKNSLVLLDKVINDYTKYLIQGNINENKSLLKFKRVPKIQRKIETKVFKIDGPGNQELKEDVPLIINMLPMMLMSMTSMITIINIINNITMKEKTLEDSLGSLIVASCMLIAMILYPILSNVYRKKRESKREIKRISEYKDYIYEKKRLIINEMNFQKNEICNTYYNTLESKEIIETINSKLWERKKDSNNFLTISLGIGRIKPNIKIEIPEEHFTIDRDKLRIQLTKLQEETNYINEVPIVFDFQQNNVVSFIGNSNYLYKYISSFLIRLFASCSYDDLKIIVLTDKHNINYWKTYIDLPYIWNDEMNLRFFGYDSLSYNLIINYIDEKYNERLNLIENNEKDNVFFENYVIFVDDETKIKNISVLNNIIRNDLNLGFTIIFNSNKMDSLPSDCKNFIFLDKDDSKLIINENMDYVENSFIPDIIDDDFSLCYKNLSNISLDFFEKKFVLPTKYDFLEMYNVGNIDSLNIKSRWNNSSIINSLSVPIGIDDNGDLVMLNVHENAHGPHGLIAGMTGSGKSELLITYILSLAVNYSPEEVQFILIDYKGGGLANTFYNSNIGMNLPHVVGVITNINENEINRSLISLKSEIKRRQKLFATASIKYNEGNMDIYKYENLYSMHNDIERLSHLFIISDEFAELKEQNPEFIEELISIARIGRSLGIHLILSTQKPSGVVDNQIWSNSRFKICLKVQDKSDSSEMIRVSDAALLKEPGRFYLQVGFNELFVKGQSAYAGSEYCEKDDVDNKSETLEFLDFNGKNIYTISSKENVNINNQGKVVSNIVKKIINLSKELNINIKGLWRELIPDKIYYDDLLKKYNFEKNSNITVVFGEYDAPEMQQKGLATVDLLGKGNLVIYGIIDSGKEMLLQVMIYSLIDKYDTSEVNIYIMDFGSESLISFNKMPHVGDVIFIDNKEKIFNTFKYLNSLIEQRKKILIDFNGDLITYNKKNVDKKIPCVILFINVIEILFENYDSLNDEFLKLSRECNKYGITIIITTNSINSVRTKILQNFKQTLTLELKDKYDYSNIYGSRVLNIPSKIKGRGLLKLENIYEFQTAYISDEMSNIDMIENRCNELVSIYNKVRAIPVLPTIVTYDIIKKYLNDSLNIPIGVNVDNLNIIKYGFMSKRGVLISGLDIDILINFYNSLLKNILSFNNNKVYLFNSYKKYNNIMSIPNVINNNYVEYLNQLKNFAMKLDNKNEVNYFICFLGIYDIYSSFDILMKKEFNNILKLLNEKDNVSIIFIEASNVLKKLEFEEFYKTNINNNRGIWIGNGVSEQMILKSGRMPREYRDTITDKFGFVFENGIITKIKLLDYFNGDENEE